MVIQTGRQIYERMSRAEDKDIKRFVAAYADDERKYSNNTLKFLGAGPAVYLLCLTLAALPVNSAKKYLPPVGFASAMVTMLAGVRYRFSGKRAESLHIRDSSREILRIREEVRRQGYDLVRRVSE
ncbi:hypothetical protein KA107_00155 [Candidatus Pacearchaeota archaeon]|nr:hypothetical protein [Candidatus Pacearchaeota archaeon]